MNKFLLAMSIIAFGAANPAVAAQSTTRLEIDSIVINGTWYCMWEYDQNGRHWRCTYVDDGGNEPIIA